jgi:LytS/YehU family sensor histidine kinase
VKLKEALQEKNHAMELALVKSQLDPHFLFNTINNIDVLILKDADEASDYLNRLSDIMRFMLYETKTNVIALSREVDYIEKYIALQKIRTANDTYVDFRLIGSPRGRVIAPMVFIPFIENAFKHTTNKKVERAIRIELEVMPEAIRMSCINRLDPSRTTPAAEGGLGNELIRKRLELLYPGKHLLEVRREINEYQVNLLITS